MNEKLATYTFLIVDDNITNRLILNQSSKELDLPKLEAANSEEVLTLSLHQKANQS